MGSLGLPEMMALFVIALLLFGPKKLPELGRTLGKGLSEFRRAKNELTSTLESHMREIERETQLEEAQKRGQIESSPSYTYPHAEHNAYDPEYHGGDHQTDDLRAAASHPTDPVMRELTPDQQAAVDANAAAANPIAHGVPPLDTVARSNGFGPVPDRHA